MREHTNRKLGVRRVSMVVIALLALTVLFASAATTAGAAWKRQSKKQSYSIDFVSATRGFAVAGGKLACTTNGGKSWKKRSLPVAAYRLEFVSKSVGWVPSPTDSKIYKTTNGGKSWTTQTTGADVTWDEVCFVDKKNGWACGSGDTGWAIVRTTNGGTTWTVVKSGTEGYLQALSFADKKNGVCGGGTFEDVFGSRVFTTHDGGLTWTEKFVAGTKLQSACMITSKYGWVGGYEDSSVFRTKNGGTTWTKVKIGKGIVNDVNAITFTSKNRGWILAGKLYSTKNGGKTWKAMKAPVISGSPTLLTGLAVANAKNIWVSGYGGIWKMK
jgi:photosystem II stability/assembly factor-like uncharacterized protein